jgi:hypothetical protein
MPAVDSIITFPGHNLLSGHIRIGDPDPSRQATLNFRVPENEFNAEWLRIYCTQQHRRFVTVSKSIGNDLYEIATRLHPPRIVPGVSRLGWDPDRNAFILTKRVFPRNEPSRTEESLVEQPHPMETAPDVTDMQISDARPSLDAGIPLWTAFVIGAIKIIAPIFSLEQPPVLITGDFKAVSRILKAAGGYLYLPTVNASQIASVEPYLAQHNLPVFAIAESQEELRRITLHKDSKRIITGCSRDFDLTVAELMGFNIVKVGDCEVEAPAMGLILPFLLQYVLEQGSWSPGAGNLMAIGADLLQKWTRFSFESVFSLKEAVGSWQDAKSPGARVMLLINQLIDNHFLGVQEQKLLVSDNLNLRDAAIRVKDILYVPIRGLGKAAGRAGLPVPPANLITQWLRKEGVLAEEVSPLGQAVGWGISMDTQC